MLENSGRWRFSTISALICLIQTHVRGKRVHFQVQTTGSITDEKCCTCKVICLLARRYVPQLTGSPFLTSFNPYNSGLLGSLSSVRQTKDNGLKVLKQMMFVEDIWECFRNEWLMSTPQWNCKPCYGFWISTWNEKPVELDITRTYLHSYPE